MDAMQGEARAIEDEKPLFNRTRAPGWLVAERAPREPYRPGGEVFMPVTEAKAQLTSLVTRSDIDDVTIMKHGRPAAVLISHRRFEALLEEIEDLKDRLSVHERDGVTIDFDKAMAELGIDLS